MDSPIQVPIDSLSRDALDGLIEEFVTRSGTDYGLQEVPLDQRKQAVVSQLERGDVVVVFDPESETANLMTRDELRRLEGTAGA